MAASHGASVHGFLVALALISITPPQPPAPPSLPYQDLAPEFVEKIVAAVAPLQQVRLVPARDADGPAGTGNDDTRARQWETSIAEMLAARGLHAVDRPDGAATVAFTCSQNLRERVCAADIRKGDASQLVIVARRHDAAASVPRSTTLALDVRTLFTQSTPILDVVQSGDRLVVLEPYAVSVYQRRQDGWQFERTRPIASSRVPARDVRGRLRLDGSAIEAFLPGVICRASLDALNLTCADEQQPWPIGIENAGMAAGRNYFTTPEGLAFFSAAPLGRGEDATGAASARWLLTAQDGRLRFLDAERRTIESSASAGDDVAGITVAGAACGAGSYVLLSSRAAGATGGPGGTDAAMLQMFQVIGRRLIAAASPFVLPGPLTALWAAPGSSSATAVSRDTNSGRYDAFHIAIACSR